MHEEKQDTQAILDHLANLMTDTNKQLSSRWKNRLANIELVHGAWAYQALMGQKAVQVTKLKLIIPCYEPLAFRHRADEKTNEPRRTLSLVQGKPSFFRKIFKNYRDYHLCIETWLDGANVAGQISLQIPEQPQNESFFRDRQSCEAMAPWQGAGNGKN